MVAEVYAGLGALKAAFDVAKGLKEINDAAVRNASIIELQEKILNAQQEHSGLLQRMHDLEEENAALRKWEEEKHRYELKELPPGVFVLSLKQEMTSKEPHHSLCQTCYQRGKKSILHADEPKNGIYHLYCYECGTKLRVGNFRPRTASEPRTGGPHSWMGL